MLVTQNATLMAHVAKFGDEARRAAQDARQFEPAAVEGLKAIATLRFPAKGQAASRRSSPASSRLDPPPGRAGDIVMGLRSRRVGGGAEPLRGLRPC